MRLRATLLLIGLFLLAFSVVAQDVTSTAETPTAETTLPVEALLPSEIPSETPIPTDIVVTEPSATETPTTTPTTTEVFVESTASVDPSPIIPEVLVIAPEQGIVEASWMIAFSDTFDTDSGAWLHGLNRGFEPNENGMALRIYNSDTSSILNLGDYSDLRATARFIVNYGTAYLSVRQSGAGDYTVALDAVGNVTLYRANEVVGSAIVAPSLPDQWRTLGIAAFGNSVRVTVDDLAVLTYTDLAPLPAGKVAFHATFAPLPENYGTPYPPVNTLRVDDFTLSLPNTASPILLPAQTETPLPENALLLDNQESMLLNSSLPYTPQFPDCLLEPISPTAQRIAFESESPDFIKVTDFELADLTPGDPSIVLEPDPSTFLTRARIFNPIDDSTITNHHLRQPTISPDGEEVAYVAFYEHVINETHYFSWGLFALNIVTCNIRTIVPLSDQPIGNPDWSPDGLQLVYDTSNGLSVVASDGQSQPQALANTQNSFTPSWAPASVGNKIAFQRNNEIFVYDLSNASATQLTSGLGTARYPAWSPDGNWILFSVSGPGPHTPLLIVPATGGAFEVLNTDFAYLGARPAWSPDGDLIAFHDNSSSNTDLYYVEFADAHTPYNPSNYAPQTPFASNGVFNDEDVDWWGPESIGCPGGSSLFLGEEGEQTALLNFDECPPPQCTVSPLPAGVSYYIPLMYTDMKSIIALDSSGLYSGLYVHDGPTWNARKLPIDGPPTVLLSTDQIPVDAKMTMPNGEIWFRVENYDFGIAGDGWILASSPYDASNNTTTMTDYVSWIGGPEGPCSHLADIKDSQLPITFVYDRLAAAKYAMAHAYRNSEAVQTGPVYIEIEGGIVKRTTNHLETVVTDTTIDNNVPIPGLLDLPYFYFGYSFDYSPDSGGSSLGKTGSSPFNSEAIWMGGMPMLKDGDENLSSDCENDRWRDGAGWRYCNSGVDGTKHMTEPFKDHELLLRFFSETHESPRLPIPIEQHGHRVGIFGDDRTVHDSYIGELPDDGGSLLLDATARSALHTTFIDVDNYLWTNKSDLEGYSPADLQTGDYVMTAWGGDPDRHGFLIVGWGPIKRCDDPRPTEGETPPPESSAPDALDIVWDFAGQPQNNKLYVSYPEAIANEGNNYAIPYVVDFPGPFPYTFQTLPDGTTIGGNFQTQRPRPRPYYCAGYRDNYEWAHRDSFFSAETGFQFVILPNVLEIPANQLFVSTSWTWEAGQ
jgi:hypothetical protein